MQAKSLFSFCKTRTINEAIYSQSLMEEKEMATT
jgi:hypothetical protein